MCELSTGPLVAHLVPNRKQVIGGEKYFYGRGSQKDGEVRPAGGRRRVVVSVKWLQPTTCRHWHCKQQHCNLCIGILYSVLNCTAANANTFDWAWGAMHVCFFYCPAIYSAFLIFLVFTIEKIRSISHEKTVPKNCTRIFRFWSEGHATNFFFLPLWIEFFLYHMLHFMNIYTNKSQLIVSARFQKMLTLFLSDDCHNTNSIQNRFQKIQSKTHETQLFVFFLADNPKL